MAKKYDKIIKWAQSIMGLSAIDDMVQLEPFCIHPLHFNLEVDKDMTDGAVKSRHRVYGSCVHFVIG